MKRILATMLILAMSVSVFSACSKTASKDAGGKVTLRWVFPGPGKQAEQDKVYAEFNKRLQEYLPNTEVKFECYANNEYAEKWKLMAASGEDVDLVGVYGLNVAEEIRKGAFIPVDDLIKNSAPEIPKQLPAVLLKQARLDNQTYYIPAYQMIYGMLSSIRLPEELVKKSNLDLDKLKEIALSEPMLTNKFFDYFEENYLKPLKASGNLQKGVSTSSWEMLMNKNLDNLEGAFVIKKDDPSCKVYYYDELPEIKAYYEKMRDWYQKGYIRSDVQSVQNFKN